MPKQIRTDAATRFRVPGEPVAKARARTVRVGNGVRTYTPAKTVDFENRVRVFAAEAGVEMIAGPVALKVIALFTCPKSAHRKRAPRPEEWRTKKPDLDNVVKAVKDALTGLCYADDNQVAKIEAIKVTAAQGEPPGTLIEVWGLR